jgi:hypothetical protein
MALLLPTASYGLDAKKKTKHRASNGMLCTIVGTAGKNKLKGTSKSDVICGRGGNDTIDGKGGNDFIDGGPGNDQIIGGTGNDSIYGLSGNDKVLAGPGNDFVSGGAGTDLVQGDAGDDTIYGDPQPDNLFGGPGNDYIDGGEGYDYVDGGPGENSCVKTSDEPQVGSCRYDWRGPAILSITPSSAQVSPGETLRIQIHATDESGISSISFSTSVGQTQRDICGQSMRKLSGNGLDEIWFVDCVIPANASNGLYTIIGFGLDVNGSYTNTNGGTLSRTRGSFQVVNGNDDFVGPDISLVSVSSPSVTIGDQLTIQVSARDTSGVAHVSFSTSINGVQHDICTQPSLNRFSGDAFDGIWSYNCTIPASARSGTYIIRPYARDSVENYTNMNGGVSSQAIGSFTVLNGNTDFVGPNLVSVSSTPSVVAPGDLLTIRAHWIDPSGVSRAGFWFSRDNVQRDFCGQSMSLVSGTIYDGIWEYQCRVPQNTVVGNYMVRYYSTDVVGNDANVNSGVSRDVTSTFTLQ